MIGYITSYLFQRDIENSNPEGFLFKRVEDKWTEDQFIECIQASMRVPLSTLIIDITNVRENVAYKGIQLLRVQKPNLRIILFAPGFIPGNSLIAACISLGIWDIVAPEIPDIPEDQEELEEGQEIVFSHYITSRLETKANYADVVRWHTNSSLESFNEKEDSKKNDKQKKQKINRESKQESKVIYENRFVSTPNNIVTVINLTKKAGSSFISLNLAKLLSDYNLPVTYIDSPIGKGEAYLQLGLYEDEEFYSLTQDIQEKVKPDIDMLPVVNGLKVSTHIPTFLSKKEHNWNAEDTFYIAHHVSSGISVFDLGYNYDDERIEDLINISSLVIVVLEPNPTELTLEHERLAFIKELVDKAFLPVVFVANKWSDAVNERKFEEDIEINLLTTVSAIPLEMLHKSWFANNYVFPIEIDSLRENMIEEFKPILAELLTEEQLKTLKLKKTVLQTILRPFTRKK